MFLFVWAQRFDSIFGSSNWMFPAENTVEQKSGIVPHFRFFCFFLGGVSLKSGMLIFLAK